jgi:WD40 repeat protein
MQSVDCIGGWLVERERAIDDLEIGRSLIAATSGPRSGDFTAVAVDGTLVGHDARARTVAELGTAPRGTTSIARSTEWLALGSSDGFVELQRISDGHAASAWRTRALDLSISALAASPEGRTVVAGDSDHSIAALDARDGSIVWRREIPLQEPNPKRRRVLKPFFLDGGRAVTFAGMLAGTRRWAFDLASGEVRADLSTGLTFETEDCVFRKTDGRIYGLGITGYITTSRGTEPDELGPFALNGGVICLNQAHDRLFAATRDGSMRVAGFDPLLEIGRFAAPPGNPLAISFDDETDSLTVLTNRGVARTWLGRPDPRKDRLLTVPFAGAKRIPRLKDAAGTK